jgi:hypothetical protein
MDNSMRRTAVPPAGGQNREKQGQMQLKALATAIACAAGGDTLLWGGAARLASAAALIAAGLGIMAAMATAAARGCGGAGSFKDSFLASVWLFLAPLGAIALSGWQPQRVSAALEAIAACLVLLFAEPERSR